MQVNRQFKQALRLASAVLVAVATLATGNSWAQTATLRAPAGSLGSNARLGALPSPVTSPASSPVVRPMTSSLQSMPTMLQAIKPIQVPQSPPLAPRAYVATPAQPPMATISGNGNTLPTSHGLPGARTETANTPNGSKVPQIKLPQRMQCLTKFYLEGNWDVRFTAVALTCEVQDQWVVMEFVVPNKQVFDTLVAAQKSGFSLWIDYTDSTAVAEGNAKRQMMMVGAQEAYQSYQHVVCQAVGQRNALYAPPRSDQAYPQYTTWCTDGKRVTPVTFATDKKSWGLMLSNVEDWVLAIDYQLAMGGRHPKTGVVRPYPIESITQIKGKELNKVAGGDRVLVSGSRWCRSDYVGAKGAANCIGLTNRSQMFGLDELKAGSQTLSEKSTAYSAFFETVAVEDTTPIPNSTASYQKVLNYYLMPGVVPPEFRNAAKGACRVALYRDVSLGMVSSGIGVGQADAEENPKDPYCRKLFASKDAFWGYSEVRKEDKCFSSKAEQAAENKPFNDEKAALYAKWYPKSPPATPTADTCQVLQ